jgi:hypothetical protein
MCAGNSAISQTYYIDSTIQQMEQVRDSNNYRGISLLGTCYKIYVKILAQRINERVEKVLKEYRYGFRKLIMYRTWILTALNNGNA